MMSLILTIIVILSIVALLRSLYKRQTSLESEDVKRILGSGNVVTQQLSLPTTDAFGLPLKAFTGLMNASPIEVRVELSSDDTHSATITGDHNLLEFFKTEVIGISRGEKTYDILVIKSAHNVSWETLNEIYITLYLPADSLQLLINEASGNITVERQTAIHEVKLFSSGNIILKNLVTPASFDVTTPAATTSENSAATLDVDADSGHNIEILSKGSGKINIVNVIATGLEIKSESSGTISIESAKLTEGCLIEQSDSGKVYVREIECVNLLIIKNSSNAITMQTVKASRDVDITHNGSGEIHIDVSCETPSMSIQSTGSGGTNIMDLQATIVDIRQEGSGRVRYKNLVTKQFKAFQNVSGALSVTKIEADSVVINSTGSGDTTITGNVKHSSIQQNGSGKVTINPAAN